MQTNDTIRLLTIETSANVAEQYNRAILSSGHAVRAISLENKDDLSTLLLEQQFDVIIFNINNPHLSIKQLQSEIESKAVTVAIILVANNYEEMRPELAIIHGARDLVLAENINHLVAVVFREYQHIKILNNSIDLQTKIDEQNTHINTLMESSRDPIAYIHEGMHVYANKTYLDRFGFASLDDIEGESVMDLTPDDQKDKFKGVLRQLTKQPDKTKSVESTFILPDKSILSANVEFCPAVIDGEECTQMIIHEHVKTEAAETQNDEQLEAKLEAVSKLDPVSGLLNRVVFLGMLTEKIICMEEDHYVLLQIGIDDFTNIEDKLGLVSCDQVIKEMGTIINDNLPDDAIAGRRDGHIFFAMLPFTSEEAATDFSQQLIKKTLDHIVQTKQHSINIECSIGICIIDDATLEIDEIVSRVNKAYSHASKAGTSKLEMYQPAEGEMSQKQIDNNWSRQIKAALTSNKFQLLFQPMIKLESDGKEHYEVFMQMLNDNDERIPTVEYMPSAERTGLSKLIDRWVLTSAFKVLSKRVETKPDTVFFVKLTGGSLNDRELFRWINAKLKELKLPPHSLIFEIKEEAVVTHLKQAQAFADLLKTIKCDLAIDEFGSGPDPFKLVEIIPATYLKFARGFAKDLANNEENQNKIKEINQKATGMNKVTIIKHVEDAATLQTIWTIGAGFIQGNFFQKPSEKMDYDFSA